VFDADGRNTSVSHVKRASASTARRRTMIRLDAGRWLDDTLDDVDGTAEWAYLEGARGSLPPPQSPKNFFFIISFFVLFK